ncbi:hydroxyacid dehydrogenase [Halorarum halophilum]|uniref:Hydroxyacid dehydrogenase n=1 Tax=Halorarum halophilum TaxID=2743090 RepID=A0A7D5KLZ7_9EURY|nr:hydroxyacid dehydrogenase [Halobaculum halophilum]QLG27282.1 hydroxyacid dehydrogenase [Halobaculum halophilum]
MAEDRWRVLVPEPMDEAGPESIADVADCVWYDEYDGREQMRADIGRFDAVVVRTFVVDGALLDCADRLKVVSKHGAGLDNVDVEASTEAGVVVCNTPDVNAPSVAEHAMTLLLAVRKRIRVADADVRGGTWDRTKYTASEVRGDTLGLFGSGSIGGEMAALARGFGMDVVFYDPYLPAGEGPLGATRVETTDDLFGCSDAVSVHTPLTDETRGAISTAELDALGQDGILVNTARGGVIDEDALVAALDDGTLAGAGLDVFAEEPPDADHPLFSFENVVVTPHVAGSTVEALERMSRGAAANVRTVYEGRLPETSVNEVDVGE